jgi:hypothetical protein
MLVETDIICQNVTQSVNKAASMARLCPGQGLKTGRGKFETVGTHTNKNNKNNKL